MSHRKNHVLPSLVIEKFVPLKLTNEVFTADAASVIFTVMFKLDWAFELFVEGLLHLLKSGGTLSFFVPGVSTVRLIIFEVPSGCLPTDTLIMEDV